MRRGFGGRRSYRKPVKRDKNHAAIVEAFTQCGATVADLAGVGGGCPDLLVGWRGIDLLVEVKGEPGPRGGMAHEHVELSDEQCQWHAGWRGRVPIVVRTVEDVTRLIAALALDLERREDALSAAPLPRGGAIPPRGGSVVPRR